MVDILIKNVDVELLYKQRDWLLKTRELVEDECADGLVHLLDAMLDEAEEM